jgi:DNA polymerase-3 subunit delta'
MTFDHILGHQRQIEILHRALNAQRLAHAYLFAGPEGIGKRLVAMALVRAIYCAQGEGCGNCAACRKVDHRNHPDIHFLEPDGTSIKIDQVRGLQRELNFKPLEAPCKVGLIDHAEQMTTGAANALLKTLEEPPGRALLILLTSQPQRLLETIRSRCQPLNFTRHPQERIQAALEQKLGLAETEAHILAALSDGSFKKAFGKDRDLYLQRRRDLLKTLTGLSAGSILPVLDFAESLASEKTDLPDILEIFQAFYRDVLLSLHLRDENSLVNLDLIEKVQRVARREKVPAVLVKLEALADARKHLERNVNRQLAMEVLLLRLTA